ncbi:hypothetical protein ABW20_dc0102990 [Dactylellina cionopaga]|nr:hypothetical protein ABW20_dc0102990 [Dactylellina cionopaga]
MSTLVAATKPSLSPIPAVPSSDFTEDVDFSLLNSNGTWRPMNINEYDAIFDFFPDTFSVEIDEPYLIIRVQTLPPKPWPNTLAGLPAYITTERFDRGYHHGWVTQGGSVLSNVTGRELEPTVVAGQIVEYFTKRLGVSIGRSDVMVVGRWVEIMLSEEVPKSVLPSWIAKLAVEYRYKQMFCKKSFFDDI